MSSTAGPFRSWLSEESTLASRFGILWVNRHCLKPVPNLSFLERPLSGSSSQTSANGSRAVDTTRLRFRNAGDVQLNGRGSPDRKAPLTKVEMSLGPIDVSRTFVGEAMLAEGRGSSTTIGSGEEFERRS